MARAKKATQQKETAANLGFESKLWEAADKMRNNMDPAEYKHVVLGLLFLKYINDSFAERRAYLEAAVKDAKSDYFVKDPKAAEQIIDAKDEYTGWNVFWVPAAARWEKLQAEAKQPTIGKLVDEAMAAIEKENPKLRGVLPKEYARPALDKHTLGELIDLIATIGLGDKESQSKDVLGRVYEYFLARFASAEGRAGGEFYTPRSVVQLLVEMVEPYQGRVYDPCCGSGGMFVQSQKFLEVHGGKKDAISVYGQESNHTTWRLCQMNLAIRGIEAHLGDRHADSFREDLHPDLKADFILANPPFNISDWKGDLLRDDKRWKYGTPPVGNANFAWVQHFIHHLAPNGVAGFVMANGSLSSAQNQEDKIREAIAKQDLVDCVVALPGQLFYSTAIPVSLWFVTRSKGSRRVPGDGTLRDRRGHTLFVDARSMGVLVDRTHRELTPADIARIAETYHAWRGTGSGSYSDIPGFCRSVAIDEVERNKFVLNPGRYVGTGDDEELDEEAASSAARDVLTLEDEIAESATRIRTRLRELGYVE